MKEMIKGNKFLGIREKIAMRYNLKHARLLPWFQNSENPLWLLFQFLFFLVLWCEFN